MSSNSKPDDSNKSFLASGFRRASLLLDRSTSIVNLSNFKKTDVTSPKSSKDKTPKKKVFTQEELDRESITWTNKNMRYIFKRMF